MTQQELVQLAQRKGTLVKIGIGVGALVLAPLILKAVAALVGVVVGLIVTAGLTYTAVMFAPTFALKVQNAALKSMKAEAAENPIETMQNLYADNAKIIAAKDKALIQFDGSLGDYHDKVIALKKKYPEDAERYETIEAKMARGLASQQRKQVQAKRALADYKDDVAKAQMLWDMAGATETIMKLSGDAQRAVFEDIKNQVAFDSVNHKLNTAVAALSAMDDDESEGLQLLSSGGVPSTTRATARVVKEA